ncbi:MAG: hypothetical protein E2O76_13235 [Caldithrix sp.]|nr:MAG: hypothetical protein E2O76_13235 [Caldithrix sp.]
MFWFFNASVVVGIFGLIGWFNYLRNQRFKAAIQAKTERFNKIIDKFGDEKQLMEFLQSDRGLAALNTLTTSGKGSKVPILVTVSAGFLMLFMGFGAMIIAWKVEDDLIFPAIFLPAMAIGLFAAAAFSYFLGRKWGLFDQDYLEAPNSQNRD